MGAMRQLATVVLAGTVLTAPAQGQATRLWRTDRSSP